jgi:cutinase
MSRPMRWITVLATTTAAAVAVLVTSGLLPRAAADCPDVEVVFGRGQGEAPGMGAVGDAFVTALQQRSGRPIASYAVNYPVANLEPADPG